MGGRGSRRSFADEQRRAVAICVRMDERVGLVSMAAYWPNRSSPSELAEAEAAERQSRADSLAVKRFIRWGLQHHGEAMCGWAESALALSMTCSDAFVQGWEQVLAAWREGSVEPNEPRYAFFWLVALWQRRERELADASAEEQVERREDADAQRQHRHDHHRGRDR